MVKWEKRGLLFCADKNYPWMQTHASTPFPVHLEGSRYQVFFSTRNAGNQSSITSLELELLPTPRVISIGKEPLLVPGTAGLFDDSGVTMSQLVPYNGTQRLYYQGWNLGATVPFRCFIGMATAQAGGAFQKYDEVPLLDRAHTDPYSLSYPWIVREGNLWRMWYGSTLCWEKDGLDVQHVIKYAESSDGLNWQRENIICIPLRSGESGVVRPCVVKSDGYHMWYSVRIGRKETYRLGYAISQDGINWKRNDELLNFTGAETAWDSDMQCYPVVFNHEGQFYMLYNGNRFGLTGFGLAVWKP